MEVVVPRRMALRHVEPFVQEKSRWIERTLRRFREAEEALPAPELEHGGSVPYLGAELFLRVSVEPGRVRDHVARRGDVLHVKV
ncbi:MAG TPA: YgjP-like metallopeptidase domain-containing protein, partial [Thermoleophilaceae bacterium]|nr:YgjP-like metallopeptidase domain-containing protein [Thermoleophilaceae bacterium]